MKNRIDYSWKYVIVAYVVFGAMVLGMCGTASMVFHASPVVMRILSNVCAWSPTIVLFLMLKRLRNGQKISDFLIHAFEGKIKISLLCLSVLVSGVVFVLAMFTYTVWNGMELTNIVTTNGYTIWAGVLFSLLSGPTGEECGWRGYLRVEFQEKYGFLKGNLVTGLVWTFWHTVLWAVDNKFTSGWLLVLYILSNIIVVTSIHMIMAVVMERENNLIYAIMIHFLFNLPYSFLSVNISFYVIISGFYLALAVVLLLFRKRKLQRN